MSWQGQPAERQISRRRRRWAADNSVAMATSVAAVQCARNAAFTAAAPSRGLPVPPCRHEHQPPSSQPRGIERIITGQATSDGAGVKLTRVLTQNLQRRLDPFLMLDAFGTDNPGDYIGGFPDHPHRGFETVTYMLDGRMRHRDSAGNEGLLAGGGVQWMTAGRGVIHSEMPEQEAGRMEGFQLWLNLPAKDKMCPPWYRDIPAAEIPEVQHAAGRGRAHHRRRQPRRGRRDAARGDAAAVPGPVRCRPGPSSSSRCRPATTPSSTSTAASCSSPARRCRASAWPSWPTRPAATACACKAGRKARAPSSLPGSR